MLHASEGELATRILIAAIQSGSVISSNADDVCNYYDKIFARIVQLDRDIAQREQASFADVELP